MADEAANRDKETIWFDSTSIANMSAASLVRSPETRIPWQLEFFKSIWLQIVEFNDVNS